MRKEKKASREEAEIVCVTEFRRGEERHWVFVKRPEKGRFSPHDTYTSAS
jgi:hypothetical protein